MCRYELPTQGFRKSSSDRQTDELRVVTSGHVIDKDGGHTIGSAISENNMLHANRVALSSIEPELWAIEVYNFTLPE